MRLGTGGGHHVQGAARPGTPPAGRSGSGRGSTTPLGAGSSIAAPTVVGVGAGVEGHPPEPPAQGKRRLPDSIVAGIGDYAAGQLPAAFPAGALFLGQMFLAFAEYARGTGHLSLGPGRRVVNPE